jgi:pimeloyl-ACP methyl ester carboxylesterase
MVSFNLKYSDQGAGQPVVMVHGFPLSRRMWDDDLAVLGKRCRVIAPDLPGFGESVPGTQAFTMERCADDLEALLSAMQLQQKIVLLGLSMGGYISFEFVRKYQERLRALVLVATHPFPDSDSTRQGRYETAEFVRQKGSVALAERLVPKFLGKTSLEAKPQVVERLRGLISSNSPDSIANACLGLASRRDSAPLLPQISVPTLIVAGGEDTLIPREQTEHIHRGVANSRFIVVQECGHIVNLEQPAEFQNVVLQFLSELA